MKTERKKKQAVRIASQRSSIWTCGLQNTNPSANQSQCYVN